MKAHIHQKYKLNISVAGYARSSVSVPSLFFVLKIILTKKIVVMFLFVCNIKMIGMLLLMFAPSSPEKQTKICNREVWRAL